MSTITDSAATTQAPHPRRWQALGLLGVAQLMLILDVTVVAIAIPQLGRDLEMGREALTWVMSAYTLAFGGLMLVGGRAADLFGARRQVLVGLTVFTAASLVAGLATDAASILGARVGQGVGAAMLSPAALSIVVRLFDGEERNRALGVWSALGGVGAALGVLLGGVITAGPGWEWVFFVNVPIGMAVGVALLRVVPPMAVMEDRSRLDVVGAVLMTAATGVLIYAFINAGDVGWGAGETVALLVAGAVLYGVLATWLRAARNPLVPSALVVRRPVAAGTFVLFVATALMVAMFFLGTFFLQDVRGHGPLATGLLFLPLAAATMAGAQAGERLFARLGGRTVAVSGLLVTAAGLLAASGADAAVVKVTATSVASVGLGALFVVASVTALSTVEPHHAGTASGLLSTFHELGAASGAAVMSGVVGAGLAADSLAAIERGYLVAAAAAAAAALIAAVLIPGRPGGTETGDAVSERSARSEEAPAHRPVTALVLHYAEMVLAMLVGMATLFPMWEIATGPASEGTWVNLVEVEMLVMATAMTVPMALWMVRRGHGRRPIVEMSVAMYAGFVVLFPFLWTGTLDDMGVMMVGHVLMPIFMLGAMLLRREEYVHAHRAHRAHEVLV